MKQKTLNFGHKDDHSVKNLYKSTCNEVAINFIYGWPKTLINNNIFCIYGPTGSGKTLCCQYLTKKHPQIIYINCDKIGHIWNILICTCSIFLL